MPAPIAPLLFAGPIVYIPFHSLEVLTVIRGFFSLFRFLLACKRRVLCRLGVLCTSLLSYPSFSISVVHRLYFLLFFSSSRSCVLRGVWVWVFRWHTIRLVSACLRLLFAAITSLHRIARFYTIITHGTVFAKHMHAIPLPVVYSLPHC